MKQTLRPAHHFPAADEQNGYFLEAVDLWTKRLLVPRIPTFISSVHLTVVTLPLAVGNIAASLLLGQKSLPWLILFICLHHFADLLDGAVGRYRKTGLFRWGYYMDKLVDYIFVGSVCLSLTVAYPDHRLWTTLPLILYGGLMLQSILFYAATEIPEKTYMRLGPTEMKLFTVLALLAVYLMGSVVLLPILIAINLSLVVTLGMVVFQSQQYLRQLDMKYKRTSL